MPQGIPPLEICENIHTDNKHEGSLDWRCISCNAFKQLLMLGDGKAPPDPNTGLIQFPHNFCNIVCSVDELKANVFPDIHHN